MTEPNNGKQNGGMRKAVQQRQERRASWERDGERPLWSNLSMIGSLGWLMVTPILIGVAVGRWLDGRFQTGIFWSGAMIMLGAGFGGYLVWQRMNKEQ